jgi:hypothetical protein
MVSHHLVHHSFIIVLGFGHGKELLRKEAIVLPVVVIIVVL